MRWGRLLVGDCIEMMQTLPEKSVQTCVTSPPYFGLRDYGVAGQIGLEPTPDEYVAQMVAVFREVWRVLRDDGTLWLNLGDSYSKAKNRHLIPHRVALALQADGWTLRDEIVWHKPRTTPAPVKDRTVSSHEMIFLLSKQPRYFFDYLAIEEPAKYAGDTRQKSKVFRRLTESRLNTKNSNCAPEEGRIFTVRATRRKRSVWSISPSPYKDAHFATFPIDLIEPCILAGSRRGDIVLDPFMGAGTTACAATKHLRRWVGCELNPEYADIARARIDDFPFPGAFASPLAWDAVA